MTSFLLWRRLPVSSPLFVSYYLPSFFSHQYLIRFNSRLSRSPQIFSSTLSTKEAAEGISGHEDTMTSAVQAMKITSRQEKFAVPKNFPFEIVESVENECSLYKSFIVTFYGNTSDENIEVEISASSWVLEKIEDEEVDDDGKKANKEDDIGRTEKEADGSTVEGDEDDYLYATEFRVEIDKGNGRKLWFSCRFPGNFSVYKIHISPEKYCTDWGVNDADLLKAAQRCLEARGIDSSLAAFAEKYLANMKRKHHQVEGD